MLKWLIIMEIQIKTSYVVRMAIIKIEESTSVDKDMGKRESLCTTSGNINWCSHYRIQLEAHSSGKEEWDEGSQKVQTLVMRQESTRYVTYNMMNIINTVVCYIWKPLREKANSYHHRENFFPFIYIYVKWASSGRWWRTGKPACCSPWDCKESDTTEQLNNNKWY